ncbi:NB-ARC domain-containing protein [Colletotrichum tofieldiae]|nr:NB-ARC domain-containing protein [Colletotrichum tofieldiae]
MLYKGHIWGEIVDTLVGIVNSSGTIASTFGFVGLVAILSPPNSWERARRDQRRAALRVLYEKKAIHHDAQEATKAFSFVTKHIAALNRALPMRFLKEPATIVGSAASDPIGHQPPDDADLLLVLASFLAPGKEIPLDLFIRGAGARTRWGSDGKPTESRSLVDAELSSVLADRPKLENAFKMLCSVGTIKKINSDTFSVSTDVSEAILISLDNDQRQFWKQQALIVAYRALTWKYLEPSIPHPKPLQAHVEFVLKTHQDVVKHLPSRTILDLVLTLTEASRLRGMAWKRFVLDAARKLISGLNDPYAVAWLGVNESLFERLSGNTQEAIHILTPLNGSHPEDDARMHSARGFAAIQASLNSIQVEELPAATAVLEKWQPHPQLSVMDYVVLYRKHFLLAKILRYQGHFEKALDHLKESQDITSRCDGLVFEEEVRDFASSYADTLRELNRPSEAEKFLCGKLPLVNESARNILNVSLAESLFAQWTSDPDRDDLDARDVLRKAGDLCLQLHSVTSLPKYEKLRVCITLAKSHHVQSHLDLATMYWTEALDAVSKFAFTSGITTKVIMRSMMDILEHQHSDPVVVSTRLKSHNEFATLKKFGKKDGISNWVPGLKDWEDYLDARAKTPSSHL